MASAPLLLLLRHVELLEATLRTLPPQLGERACWLP